MTWILILTCLCGQPARNVFPTKALCENQAHRELYARNINVPSYRCDRVR